MKKKEKTKSDGMRVLEVLGFASGIGFHFVVIVGLGIFLGTKADAYFSISPWGALIGIVLGTGTAMWSTYKKLLGKSS